MALLAAVTAGLPVLATLAHGGVVWVMALAVAAAAALFTYVTAVPVLSARVLQKKRSSEDRKFLVPLP